MSDLRESIRPFESNLNHWFQHFIYIARDPRSFNLWTAL
jgi:hypothetical protein